jgi:ribose/xylose/arabinose/galactoside ABC-type transport system permease subunit
MTPEKDSDVIRQQLSALISLYEHHLDLFWKWITLYATIVTALSVYIFNKELTLPTRRLFPILIAMASLGVAFGCFIMWRWLKELEAEVRRIASGVDAPRYPGFLGIRMTVAALVATLLLAAFSLSYSIFGNFE